MYTIMEPARNTPVWREADVCVVGGSCTGVFAAVRAARLGARVVLIEAQGRLGGTAVNGLVNVWHTLLDDTYTRQVIGGLTDEVEKRLERAQRISYVERSNAVGARLDPVYLSYELDKLVREEKIAVYLHSAYAALSLDNGRMDAIMIENKDGRGAIKAAFFIDCTGDGDLCRDVGLPAYRFERLQPPSACFLMTGDTEDEGLGELILAHGEEFGLDDDWGWSGPVPGMDGVFFRADNHVFGVDCSRADELTQAEMEGRRRAFALEALLSKYGRREHRIVNICSHIGIRDTVHYETAYRITEADLLTGRAFDDAILHGTYCLDVHHQQDNGITFKYLNGLVRTCYGKSEREETSDWRKEQGISGEAAHFYSMPFRTLVQRKVQNLIAAGRMVNAEESAFGALRVMVNANQMGEAAGVAAYLCVHEGLAIWDVSGTRVRETLCAGGSRL